MVGLLGMLAAGGAMGARDASNATVRAMNEMEMRQQNNNMEMDRERLRQQYLDKRYGQERADNMEMAKGKAMLDERNYQRNRENKLADDEISHKRKLEIEDKRESGRTSRSNAKIAAMKDSLSTGTKGGGSGIELADGTIFSPNDADSKSAVNLVRLGLAKDIPDAYQKIYASKYTSSAASSVQGLREGTVPQSLKMSRDLFNISEDELTQTQPRLKYNPKTGGF